MNPADDEINILLPLVFGVIIVFFVAIFGVISWILHKKKVVNFGENSHLSSVFRAVILTAIGFVLFSGFLFIVINFTEILGTILK